MYCYFLTKNVYENGEDYNCTASENIYTTEEEDRDMFCFIDPGSNNYLSCPRYRAYLETHFGPKK